MPNYPVSIFRVELQEIIFCEHDNPEKAATIAALVQHNTMMQDNTLSQYGIINMTVCDIAVVDQTKEKRYCYRVRTNGECVSLVAIPETLLYP